MADISFQLQVFKQLKNVYSTLHNNLRQTLPNCPTELSQMQSSNEEQNVETPSFASNDCRDNYYSAIKKIPHIHQQEAILAEMGDALAYVTKSGMTTFESPIKRSQNSVKSVVSGGNLHATAFSLYPSPFPKKQFDQTVKLTNIFNRLIDRFTCKVDLMKQLLLGVSEVDTFCRNLVTILDHVYLDAKAENSASDATKEGNMPLKRNIENDIRLYLTRSDYMLDNEVESQKREDVSELFCLSRCGIKQVELNTMSASFGSFSEILSTMHQKFLKRLLRGCDEIVLKESKELLIKSLIPENTPKKLFAEGIWQAVKAYERKYGFKAGFTPLVLFMICEEEKNEMDQRCLSFEIEDNFNIPTLRATLDEIYQLWTANALKLDKADSESQGSTFSNKFTDENEFFPSRLLLHHVLPNGNPQNSEICVIYFRTTYSPDQFTKDEHWKMRELLEWSHAAKVPSIPSHLAGLKKMQQLWCDEAILSEVIENSNERKLLQAVFALQVDPNNVGDPTTEECMQLAVKYPERFILKPQREGGGNNLHSQEIVTTLNNGKKSEEGFKILQQYVLMERINVPSLPHIRLKTFPTFGSCTQVELVKGVSELGIFGRALYSGEDEVLNDYAGYLLRTKGSSSTEGGIMTGFAIVDSPLLFDENEEIDSLIRDMRKLTLGLTSI